MKTILKNILLTLCLPLMIVATLIIIVVGVLAKIPSELGYYYNVEWWKGEC